MAGDVLCSGVYGLLTGMLVLVGRRVGAGDGGYGIPVSISGIVAGSLLAGPLVSRLGLQGAFAAAGAARASDEFRQRWR